MADEGILFITIILYFIIKVTMCVCICVRVRVCTRVRAQHVYMSVKIFRTVHYS